MLFLHIVINLKFLALRLSCGDGNLFLAAVASGTRQPYLPWSYFDMNLKDNKAGLRTKNKRLHPVHNTF